jgi:asparagine synthase (glutamine-hydrolysing)
MLDVPLLDEPARPYALTGWLRYTARVLRTFGSAVHLCGHGGDQVMNPPLAYLSRLVRTRPRAAVGQFRAHMGLHPCLSAAEFLRILRPPSYPEWLAAAAAAVVDPDVRMIQSWGEAPRPPEWLTRPARAAVADAIRAAAPDLSPLSSRVGQHATLDRVHGCAATHRLNRDYQAVLGVRLEVPFLDGDIVETCLSTRSDHRADPLRVKPLLSDAMAGIVPPEIMARNTKASYQTDHCLGWRANHWQLAELFEDSRLAALGIVDGEQLRAAFRSGMAMNFLRVATLNEVLVCELWLRALERAGRSHTERPSEMVGR